MINSSDTQKDMPTSPAPPPAHGLMSPGLSDNGTQGAFYRQRATIQPEQLLLRKSAPPPRGLFPKIGYLWGKDPAYKVLMITIALVVVAAIVSAVYASSALTSNNGLLSWNSPYAQNPPTVVPSGTVDYRPNFPNPDTGKGSTQSSQPGMQKTPALQPTASGSPSPQPSQGPGAGGTLTVTINNVPNPVPNNGHVAVDVSTNEPGATVHLQVSYNAPPYFYTSGFRQTDDNGNATLNWNVKVFGFRFGVRATVIVIATDQQGQQVASAPVTVQVQ